ncbi:hypothetical protein GCM10010495_79130 [Kitasatospora herbaricolor]|nr:hypothetical protein GCM10010495_79130 [Kitasatospora herbaricolor]
MAGDGMSGLAPTEAVAESGGAPVLAPSAEAGYGVHVRRGPLAARPRLSGQDAPHPALRVRLGRAVRSGAQQQEVYRMISGASDVAPAVDGERKGL